MPFRLGIIGCGTIGNVHAAAATRAGVSVAGAWDLHPTALEKLCSSYEGCVGYGELDALLSSDVDAVAVAVPNDAHCACALAGLEAGKHVLLEKPMALSVAQCDAINSAAAASGRVLQLGFVCRGLPAARAAKKLIDAGRFGEIYHVKCSLYRTRGIPGLGGWFTTKARSGGGPLIDLGVHVLDLAMHLSGNHAPTRASGQVVSKFGSPISEYLYNDMWAGPPRLDGVFDVEDGAVALIRFEGGMTLELNVTWAANIPENALPSGVTVLGTKAGCFFELFGDKLRVMTQEDDRLVELEPEFECDDAERAAWDAQYEQFIAAVRDRTAPHADGAAGRRVQAVIEAIYASSEQGCEVAID